MSLGGRQITEDDIRQYLAMQGNAPAAAPAMSPAMSPYMDPTAMAQQAILARPMRPSFTGQPLLSREVPLGIQGDTGLAYPSMANTGLLNVPSYTSRYAGTDSGGGGGGSGAMQTGAPSRDQYSLTNGLVASLLGMSAVPNAAIPVENMGTYANMPSMNDFGFATQAEANAIADAQAQANNVAAGLAAAADAAESSGGGGFSNDAGGSEVSGSLGF
jgi:hypothetical protein